MISSMQTTTTQLWPQQQHMQAAATSTGAAGTFVPSLMPAIPQQAPPPALPLGLSLQQLLAAAQQPADYDVVHMPPPLLPRAQQQPQSRPMGGRRTAASMLPPLPCNGARTFGAHGGGGRGGAGSGAAAPPPQPDHAARGPPPPPPSLVANGCPPLPGTPPQPAAPLQPALAALLQSGGLPSQQSPRPVLPPTHFPVLARVAHPVRPMPPIALPPAGQAPLLRASCSFMKAKAHPGRLMHSDMPC